MVIYLRITNSGQSKYFNYIRTIIRNAVDLFDSMICPADQRGIIEKVEGDRVLQILHNDRFLLLLTQNRDSYIFLRIKKERVVIAYAHFHSYKKPY